MKFLSDHPDDICGIRMIYAPIRHVLAGQVEAYLETASQLKDELGDFMAGFDLGIHQIFQMQIFEY